MEFVSDLVRKLKPYFAEMLDGLITGAVKFALLRVNGDVVLEGAARRIIGDFTTLTPNTTRTLFQTSVVNATTRLGVIPNGTGNTTGLDLFNAQNTENAGWFGITLNPTRAQLNVIKNGAGVLVPLRFSMDSSVRIEMDTSGNINLSPVNRVFLKDCTAAPSDTPVGGGYFFVQGGALKYKGSTGTVTTIAPA